MTRLHYMMSTVFFIPISVAKFPVLFGDQIHGYVIVIIAFFLFLLVNYQRISHLKIPKLYLLLTVLPVVGFVVWILLLFEPENASSLRNDIVVWISFPLILFLGFVIPFLISPYEFSSFAIVGYAPFIMLVRMFSGI